MYRCKGIKTIRSKSYLSLTESAILRNKVDQFIEKQIENWNTTVPYANHLEDKTVNKEYYVRHLIETALRIRLLRTVEAHAQAEISKISPEAAQMWARYEMEEMIHDELFIKDYEAMGGRKDVLAVIEPFLSTKLLAGYFYYLLQHEGPLGVVVYSYLVETVNVKLDPKRIKALSHSLGEENIKGYTSHNHTDENDDHPGETWTVLRQLIKSEEDIQSIYKYLEENQRILAMYFEELYQYTFSKKEVA